MSGGASGAVLTLARERRRPAPVDDALEASGFETVLVEAGATVLVD